jgi:hypothetical protein
MNNDPGVEETWSDWDGNNRNVAVGTILASALVAGVIAYVIRRRREAEDDTLAGASSRATTAALAALGDDRLAYPRELLTEKVLPEFKPALLALLREVEAVVSQAFRRAERAIDDL